MPVFERNLIVPEDFYLAAGRAIEFYFPDVRTNLHAIGSRVHSQGAADGAGYADEAFHAAQIVLGAERYRATEVRCGVYLGEGTVNDAIGLGPRKLQDNPRQLSVTDQQVRAATYETVGNAVGVEQIEQLGYAVVFFDAKEVGGSAYSERGEICERGTGAQLDSKLREGGDDLGIINAHG